MEVETPSQGGGEGRRGDAARPGGPAYVYRVALVAAVGGLLFGYDTAVISGAIGFIQTRFELDSVLKGWATASVIVGCIAGAALAGSLSDRLGRKNALVLSAILFAVSAVGSALPRDLTEFVLARIIGGVGVGAASMVSPLYIAEISPAGIRGRLVSLNQFAIIFGMLVVYFVNALVANFGDESWNVERGWRWMLGSETLPSIVFLALLLLVPESPRWLVKQGRSDEAFGVLARVAGDGHARSEIAEIEGTIAQEEGSWALLFRPGVRLALLIGIVLAILQQVTGINVVIYYAPEIFKSAGLDAGVALNHTVVVGLINIVFTLVAIAIVDRVGRKVLLLVASAGMGISLGFLGRTFGTGADGSAGAGVVAFVLAYVAFFALAMGPVVWVVLAEIFPTKIRGRAMSIATVCLWAANFAVTQLFPLMLERLQGSVFFVYAVLCAVAFVFVALFVPETKGRSLEEIERGWLARSPGR